MNKILSIFIGLSLLVLAFGFVVYLNMARPMEKGAAAATNLARDGINKAADLGKHGIDRAADAFKSIFQSQVNIVASSTVCDATPIAELAVVRRNIKEIVDYSRTDYGSNKRIIAEQTFLAKIGFDLESKFSATYDPSNHVMIIHLPDPKVLSLESSNPAPKYFLVESGVINKITTDDHQQILMELKAQARKSADAALAIGDAKQMIETRFHDLFQAFNVKVVVQFASDQPQPIGQLIQSHHDDD